MTASSPKISQPPGIVPTGGPKHPVLATAHFAREVFLNIRAGCLGVLRNLPGSSLSFGPPRKTVVSLRRRIKYVADPRELLSEHEDACARLTEGDRTRFGQPRTPAGAPDPLKQFGGEFLQPESFLFALHQARVVDADGTIVTRDDELFGEGSPWGLEELVQRPILSLPGARLLEGAYIHAAGRWSSNYFHWVMDIACRLVPLLRFPEFTRLPVLLPAQTPRAQIEMLQRMGFAGPFVTQPARHVIVEKLYYASPVRKSYCPPRPILDALRKAAGTPAAGELRLYVSRNDAKTRRVANEAALESLLHEHGFQTVLLAGRPFPEQVSLFRHASRVIGAHGSGLANLAFAPAGTKVLEIFSPAYIHGAYFGLSDLLGMDYWYVVGPASGLWNITAPLEQVRSVLQAWESESA